MPSTNRIRPCLWFDNQAEEAAKFYTSVFKNSKIGRVSRLSEGGDPSAQQCGWLKDKYGLSWQVVPRALTEAISDPDPEKAGRVMEAMLPMKKIDIAEIKRAYAGAGS